MRISCWKCGETIERVGVDRVSKRESCSKCDTDLHCCHNCRFFDPSVHNQCRETQAEWIKEKDKANYCDYFEPANSASSPRGNLDSSAGVRKRFKDLFDV